MKAANLNATKLGRKSAVMTVTLRGMRQFRFRLWLAIQIIRVLSWVAPVKVETREE